MQIVFVLVLSITSILFAPIAQASQVVNHEAEALTLQSLGLLSGTDQGFELERIPTRVEGAVMLVRLLGKNEYAMQQSFTHPFSDVPAWASPYIGFMYANNLTTGTDPSNFSPNLPLTPNQYLSFVLRSLGYNDQNGDFQWDKAMDKSQAIGLLDSSSRNELESFRRNEMVLISYLSLREKLKDSNSTLLQKLVEEDKAVSPIKAAASGLYKSQAANNIETIHNPIVNETDNRYLISNKDELIYQINVYDIFN